MTNDELNKTVSKQVGVKVTQERVQSRIKDAAYMRIPDTTCIICNLTLVNGFTVRGESSCIDPNLFDESIGSQLAYRDAIRKLWELEAYRLCEERSTHANLKMAS
jgi:gamma-glutamyl-gamma-aminobutyrate hydrolase PuuD